LFVKRAKRANRAWSPRFEQGYSQIVDWFFKLDDFRDAVDTFFGQGRIDFSATLIIGRDHYMDAREKSRLNWRRANVVVHSKRIHCITFDELVRDLDNRLSQFGMVGRVDPQA
jgi:hypothetical protein